MLNTAAKVGEVGSLANLPTAILEKLSLSGNGDLRIDREGHSLLLRWVPRALPETAVPVANRQLRSMTAPIAGERTFENAQAILAGRVGAAQGGLGEAAGSLAGPVQFVRKLMEAWRLDRQDVVRLLGFDPEDFDYVVAVLDGRGQLRGRDVRDRIACLFTIRRALWSLFRDPEAENGWLRERHSMLNGASPLSLMLEGSMEDLLLARDYAEAATGVR